MNLRRKIFVPILVFIILASSTVGAWWLLAQNADEQLGVQFQNQTVQITALIQNRLNLYTNVLYGAEGLFAASNSVEQNEWGYYVNSLDLPDNYSGIAAMTFVERVPAAATTTYPYTIYPYTPNKRYYYPITYIVSPGTTTTGVQGFDTQTDPVRWKAIITSFQTGKPIASGVVPTISGHLPSFSIYVPVYGEGADTATLADREKSLIGFVSTGFRLDDLFNGFASDPLFDKDIHVEIYDAPPLDTTSTSTLLYNSGGANEALTDPVISTFSLISHIVVGGHIWTIYYSALPAYKARALQSYVPVVAFIVGILLSFLFSWLIYLYAASSERAEKIASRITSDLKKSQELLKVSMDGAADMIFVLTTSGKVVDTNVMATETLGYTKQELLAMPISEVFLGWTPEFFKERVDMLSKQKTISSEGEFKRKDGTTFPIETRASMFSDGQNTFVISVIRDISERKESEKVLSEQTRELERSNALMIDRELAMIQLKEKLANALSKKTATAKDTAENHT